MNKQNGNGLIDTENRPMVARGEGVGGLDEKAKMPSLDPFHLRGVKVMCTPPEHELLKGTKDTSPISGFLAPSNGLDLR